MGVFWFKTINKNIIIQKYRIKSSKNLEQSKRLLPLFHREFKEIKMYDNLDMFSLHDLRTEESEKDGLDVYVHLFNENLVLYPVENEVLEWEGEKTLDNILENIEEYLGEKIIYSVEKIDYAIEINARGENDLYGLMRFVVYEK